VKNVAQDLKYALRVLLKSPGFSVATILVLALGIGANTATFSVVNAVLLRPLPYKDSDRLVQIWHVPPQKSFPGLTQFAVSPANYVDWHDQSHAFEQMAIYTFTRVSLTDGEQPVALRGAAVSSEFFSALRSQPLLGRIFASEEDQPGQGRVVILSHALWRSHFAADPNIVGHSVSFDGQAYSVVGVMDANFRFPSFVQFWTPMAWTNKERAVRGEHHYLVIGRLKPDTQLQQAQTEMNTISSRLEQQYPEDNKGWGAILIPLREQLVGQVRPALLVLLGAVAFVLLIACANVANLTLAKTFARRKEIALRAALGAGRGRVLQQVLSETILLSLAGGLAGLLVANAGTALITKFLANSLPRFAVISIDAWVLVFTLTISLLAGITAGLAPALRLTKTNVNEALKQGARTDSDSGMGHLRSLLVVSEVALSLVLLVGAGLMIRTLWLLRGVDPGFDPHNVVTMQIVVPRTKFAAPIQQVQFFDSILNRVQTLPGVEAAGVIDDLPLSGGGSHQPIQIEGRPVVVMSEQPEVDVRLISQGYLHVLHIPLRRGREFSPSDTADHTGVVLISETMARRFWPNEDPIGKHLTMTFFPEKPKEIIGIVGDVKLDALDIAAPSATLYVPLTQLSPPSMAAWRSFGLSLVARATSHVTSVASAVTNAVREIDPQTPVIQVATMDEVISNSLSQRRFNMFLLAVFAGLAVLLAAVGIYSVLAYTVRRRVREIGIRMTLGAQISDVLHLVVLEGMTPALLGMIIGWVGAFALSRVLSSLIYGVQPTDLLTFAAVSALLAIVALLATLIPAYRATKVEPIQALREE